MKAIRVLAVLALTCASAFSADVVAPSIVAASLSPSSVDVTSAVGSITVTMQITDDDSGFSYGNLFLYNQAGDFIDSRFFNASQRTSGTALDGVYTIVVEVPRYCDPGTWRVNGFVQDVTGNRRDYGPTVTPFPIPAAMTFTVSNTGTIDNSPPVLVSHSVFPTAVTVTGGSATVTFTYQITDSPSGLKFATIFPREPGGTERFDLLKSFSALERISGSNLSGTYKVTFTLPQNSPAGTWTFRTSLQDQVGNSISSPAGSLSVNVGPAAAKFIAQAVDAVYLQFSTAGSGWVMTSSDSNDGIDAAKSLPVPDDGEATFQTTLTGPGSLTYYARVDSEEDADYLSVFRGATKVHEISGFVDWNLYTVDIPSGNHTVKWSYSKNSNGANGDDRGWVDEVRYQQTTDASLPQLQDLRLSSRSVNLLTGSKNITFRVDVTDDSNGLASGTIQLFDPAGILRASGSFDGSFPIAGDEFAGTHELTLLVPTTGSFGMWRAEVTLTEANTNAIRRYGPGGSAFPVKGIELFHAGDPSAPDTEKPLARAIEVSPGVVNVTAGATMATVTVQITDGISGFQFGDIEVINPSNGSTGNFFLPASSRISGDMHNGIYQIEVPVPAYGMPGTWTVGCYVRDNANNEQRYPSNIQFPDDVDETFAVINSGAFDLADPTVTSMDVTPVQINTSGGSAQVQVTVSLLDDLSGLKDAFAYFYDPANVFQNSLFTVLNSANRISGNDLSGTYQFSKTLPQGSALGQWQVRIFVRDKTGRTKFYGQSGSAFPEANDGFFTNSSGAMSLYASFVATYSLTGNNALAGADPDNDGRNNATELMLGTNPTSAASNGGGPINVVQDPTGAHLDFTVSPALNVTSSGGFLELRDAGGGAPLKVKGQTSSGLAGAWANATPILVSGSIYRVTMPFASGPRGFARLYFETP